MKMTVPHITKLTQEHLDQAYEYLQEESKLTLNLCNKAIEIALAEQAAQEQYITADEARALVKAGGQAEWQGHAPHWYKCDVEDLFNDTFSDGHVCKYRAVKQPEPAENDAAFLKRFKENVWADVNRHLNSAEHKPTCQVRNLDTGELKTMTRDAAKLLQAELSDTVEWAVLGTVYQWEGEVFAFDGTNTLYTYKLKQNLVKLNGAMMSREAAIALWESKKDMCDLWYGNFRGYFFKITDADFLPNSNKYESEYQLREKPKKQVSWKDVPVGVMTNKGELREVYEAIYGDERLQAVVEVSVPVAGKQTCQRDFYCKDLTLAPSSDQSWLNWRGGECPVPKGVLVEVTFRDGSGRNDWPSARSYNWEKDGSSHDIIEYRVIGITEGYELK